MYGHYYMMGYEAARRQRQRDNEFLLFMGLGVVALAGVALLLGTGTGIGALPSLPPTSYSHQPAHVDDDDDDEDSDSDSDDEGDDFVWDGSKFLHQFQADEDDEDDDDEDESEADESDGDDEYEAADEVVVDDVKAYAGDQDESIRNVKMNLNAAFAEAAAPTPARLENRNTRPRAMHDVKPFASTTVGQKRKLAPGSVQTRRHYELRSKVQRSL